MRRLILFLLIIGKCNDETQARPMDYAKDIVPLLEKYCVECHSDDVAEADLNFDDFRTVDDLRSDAKAWIKVEKMLVSRQMPPRKSDQPSDLERDMFSGWVHDFLTVEARARAGDPGRVVLRRINNDEYNYTVRDLTGVNSLNPTREFPVDGAAGEGFTNAGDALVMSPALVEKFLDAGKEVSSHAVLTPTGIRFSEHLTDRDLADELMDKIRSFYSRYVNVGIKGGDNWNDPADLKSSALNRNGSVPLQKYFAVVLKRRKDLVAGSVSIIELAKENDLSPKYLQFLWEILDPSRPTPDSFLLSRIRDRWSRSSDSSLSDMVNEVSQWQQALWNYEAIGHIGRAGGPEAWMNPRENMSKAREFRIALNEPKDGSDIIIYLGAFDLGDGNSGDYVIWKDPKLVGGSGSDIPLKNVSGLGFELKRMRRQSLKNVSKFLQSASDSIREGVGPDTLAARYGLNPSTLKVWLDYLSIGPGVPVKVDGLFKNRITKTESYDFVRGWGSSQTPSVVGNSTGDQVRIPGISKPHSVVVHPSPIIFSAVGWKSPIDGIVTIETEIADAHPECGHGVEWWVQHRTSREHGNLAKGDFGMGGSHKSKPMTVAVREGELVSIIVGPSKGNHACDLTDINMKVSEISGPKRKWNLANEVSSRIHEGNPIRDDHGNNSVWHFYKGPLAEADGGSGNSARVPPGSLLEQWINEEDLEKKSMLSLKIQDLAMDKIKPESGSPDALLISDINKIFVPDDPAKLLGSVKSDQRFGKHPQGKSVHSTDLIVKAPSVTEIRIPAELARGRTVVLRAEIESSFADQGAVQVSAGTSSPRTDQILPSRAILVAENSESEKRVRDGLKDFRQLFPASLCYPKIVPIDEVVTLALYFREDERLQELMLDKEETAQLDGLWDELLYVTKEPFKLEVAYEQIVEFSTQDRPDLVIAWKPYKEPLMEKVREFKKRLIADELMHLEKVLDFARRAWRRPLSGSERSDLKELYGDLRESEISHEESIRLTIARTLTSPAFLYRRESSGPDKDPVAVNAYELATRLSYFLWSSCPDHELLEAAKDGSLIRGEELFNQTRRMLQDPKTNRLAEQFACQWFHVRDFNRNDDKNENIFPQFKTLRSSMYGETLKFFEDMFRNNGSVLDIILADHTFVNGPLAEHYGIKEISGDEWRRIDGTHVKGRGGVLGMATILAVNSGASRTSPILRGNWIYETLLGEKLPKPPANVPDLPEKIPENLTARQLIEKHSSAKECSKCHERIDPYGFTLERFDAIGGIRKNQRDTSATLFGGTQVNGIKGLREYLVNQRLDDFLEQFCRKLLGYALGREVQLSDMLLIEEMKDQLRDNEYRFNVVVEAVISSDQFRKIRGRLVKNDD
ncbi:MAG: DUF1592 domain-containing protein [Verrucomicrobiota bacterium]|nr:DUF1592 domain-containing protein [Verrucomicrobiota bacterium]